MSREETTLRVGLCGIGLDAYWPQFEGLHARLEGYVSQSANGWKRLAQSSSTWVWSILRSAEVKRGMPAGGPTSICLSFT